MWRNTYSFMAALVLGLLCVSPPEFTRQTTVFMMNMGGTIPGIKDNYTIPVVFNTFNWLYVMIAAGLVGFYLATTDLHPALRFLMAYLFVLCFFSEVPAHSFNSYAVFTASMLFFLVLRVCDFKIIVNMVQAAFWVEFLLAGLRLAGMEVLMNLGQPEPIFFGTIMQHMRFASLLAIMSPFLLIRSKWYIVPIAVAAVLCTSSGFAISIAAGVIVYLGLNWRGVWEAFKRMVVPFKALVLASFATATASMGIAVWLGRDSFAVAMREGRFPVWMVILKSWMFDTSVRNGAPDWMGVSQDGPFNLKTLLFGHGLDTFYSRFPVYKHDANPFAQAHNCLIQLPWEIGAIGAGAAAVYIVWLIWRLYELKAFELIAGMAIILTNMSCHFPTRMTQTIWLIVAFLAMCEAYIIQNRRPKPTHGGSLFYDQQRI